MVPSRHKAEGDVRSQDPRQEDDQSRICNVLLAGGISVDGSKVCDHEGHPSANGGDTTHSQHTQSGLRQVAVHVLYDLMRVLQEHVCLFRSRCEIVGTDSDVGERIFDVRIS